MSGERDFHFETGNAIGYPSRVVRRRLGVPRNNIKVGVLDLRLDLLRVFEIANTADLHTIFDNGQFVGGAAYTAVNGNFRNWGYFGPGYYGKYPGAWFPGKWAVAGTAWAAASWATAGSYCGCEGEGTYYDYEDNVTYEDGNVMYEGEPVATEEQYYAEAEQIADSGAETGE